MKLQFKILIYAREKKNLSYYNSIKSITDMWQVISEMEKKIKNAL